VFIWFWIKFLISCLLARNNGESVAAVLMIVTSLTASYSYLRVCAEVVSVLGDRLRLLLIWVLVAFVISLVD